MSTQQVRLFRASGEQTALNLAQVTKWYTSLLVNTETMQLTGGFNLHVFTADGRETTLYGESAKTLLAFLEDAFLPLNDDPNQVTPQEPQP